MVLDRHGRRAVVLEVCRTDDLEPGYWREQKYAALLQAMKHCTGFSEVSQATLMVGIRGNLNEQELRVQLAPLRLSGAQFTALRRLVVAGTVRAAPDILRVCNTARSGMQAFAMITGGG